MKVKPAKVHRFWIPTSSSVGTSRYRNFIAKADYDALMELYKSSQEEVLRLQEEVDDLYDNQGGTRMV